MTEIPFEFQGFTLKQCEILSSLNEALRIDSDPLARKQLIYLVHSRFTGPRLDKHWDGIKLDLQQLFSNLKKEISEEQWPSAPDSILSFIEHFSDFSKLKDKFDQAMKDKENADKIEREKQLAKVRAERLEAEAKANLKAVKIIGNQLTQENAENRKAPSKDDYCQSCGQLTPLYSECYC